MPVKAKWRHTVATPIPEETPTAEDGVDLPEGYDWANRDDVLPEGDERHKVVTGPTASGIIDVVLNGRGFKVEIGKEQVFPYWVWSQLRESGFLVI